MFVLLLKGYVILEMFRLRFGLLMLLVFSLFMLFRLMLTKGVYIVVEVKFDNGFGFLVFQFVAFFWYVDGVALIVEKTVKLGLGGLGIQREDM